MPSRCLLIVEGPDDNGVLLHLLSHHNIPLAPAKRSEDGKISLRIAEGIDGVKAFLNTQLKLNDEDAEFQRVGAIVDTDNEYIWHAFKDILLRSGYTNIPDRPSETGTVLVEEGLLPVGVWLMPDNKALGSLETFMQSLIPSQDRLWDRAVQAVSDIPSEDQLFANGQKAHIHTWLAWQEEPGLPMGLAITKQSFDADAPQARQLIAWVHRLFAI